MDLENVSPRFTTGVPQLDTILMGGLFPTDTYLIYGSPGSGKTILSHQICFHQIRQNNIKCVYLNLLIESPLELISHLENFSFFDKSYIPDSLYYLMAYNQIKKKGIFELIPLITSAVSENHAQLFIFEGIENALYNASNKLEFLEMLAQVRTIMRIFKCTAILTSRDVESVYSQTVVDGVMELSESQTTSIRSVRELIVRKTRGSAHLPGAHQAEITNQGFYIHPRTEIRFPLSRKHSEHEHRRLPMGNAHFDAMLNGGIMSGTVFCILGEPGTGKTTMGMSFLTEGVQKGQCGIYVGFRESPEQLFNKADSLDIPLRKYTEDGKICIKWFPTLEHLLDSVVEQVFDHLSNFQTPFPRVFIDGVEGISRAVIYPERLPRFLSAFFNYLRSMNVTTAITKQISLFGQYQLSSNEIPIDELSETVVLLRYMRVSLRLQRALSILKVDENDFDPDVRSYTIGKGGLLLQKPSAEFEEAFRSQHTRY